MYLRAQHDWGPAIAGSDGRTSGRTFGRARSTVSEPTAGDVGWIVDLAVDVGSPAWWRGLATCLLLLAGAWLLTLSPAPVADDVVVPLVASEDRLARSVAIAPLGRGGEGGRRSAPTALAVPLAHAPERAQIQAVAILGTGDTIGRLLRRMGADDEDARTAAALAAGAAGTLPPGLPVEVTLGSRPDLLHPRALVRLTLRARADLAVTIRRADGRLVLIRQAIAIDRTPIRIGGVAGTGLYEAVRAAGVPAEAAAEYLKAIASRVPFGEVIATDAFDLVIERERAATGETRWGRLLFAGFGEGAHQLRLVRWNMDGRSGSGQDGWYDADGQKQRQGSLGMPVAGHITSGFGMRFHPILGFSRMHKGIDIGAPVGTPVFAVIDGAVLSAGWSHGYGNFIRLAHAGGMTSGYGHLSRIAVRAGEAVRRGQIIGYVGSTGLSTGPHLHWEIARGGMMVNPLQIAQAGIATLGGTAMPAFRARVAWLMGLKRGG